MSHVLEGRSTPVAVSEELPQAGVKVLAHYISDSGEEKTICAIWVPARSRTVVHGLGRDLREDYVDRFDDDDFTEYCEEDDTYYWPEGWYEAIENWPQFGWVKVIEGEVDYWQSLPKWHPTPPDVEEACEICNGAGTVDETLGGYSFSNPAAECPGCEGSGCVSTPPAEGEEAPAAATEPTEEETK